MRAAAIALVVVVAGAALAAMRIGWTRRAARTAQDVPALPAMPDPGALTAPRLPPVPGTYVSTTFATSWLDRVVAHGLGVRSAVVVQVHDVGIVLRRQGAPDVFIPAGAVRAVSTTDGIAGKVVGGRRLVVVTWHIGDTVLTTGVLPGRADDRDLLVSAIGELVDSATTSTAAEEQG